MFDVEGVIDSGIESEEERSQCNEDTPSEDDGEPMPYPWLPQQKTNDEQLNEAAGKGEAKEPRPEHKPWWYRPDQKVDDKEMKEGQLDPIDLGNWPNSLGNLGSPSRAESPGRSSPPLYEVELTASDEDDDASVLELVIPMSSSSCKKNAAGPRPRQWVTRKVRRNRKRPASSILYLEATLR